MTGMYEWACKFCDYRGGDTPERTFATLHMLEHMFEAISPLEEVPDPNTGETFFEDIKDKRDQCPACGLAWKRSAVQVAWDNPAVAPACFDPWHARCRGVVFTDGWEYPCYRGWLHPGTCQFDDGSVKRHGAEA